METAPTIKLPDQMEKLRLTYSAHPFQFIGEIGYRNIKEAHELLFNDEPDERVTDGIRAILLAGKGKICSLENKNISALKFYQDAETLALKQIGREDRVNDILAYVKLEIGVLFRKCRCPNAALTYLNQSLSIASDPNLINKINYIKSMVEFWRGDPTHLDELEKRLETQKQHGNWPAYLFGRRSILIHRYKKQKVYYNEVIQDIQKLIQEAKDREYIFLADVLKSSVILVYIEERKFDIVEEMTMDTLKHTDSLFHIVTGYEDLMLIEYLKGNYDSCIELGYKLLSITEENGLLDFVQGEKNFIALVNAHYLSNFNKALYYYKQAYDLGLQLLKLGFPNEGRIAGGIQAYVQFLKENLEKKFVKGSDNDSYFVSLVDKSWRDITNLFSYNLLMYHKRMKTKYEDYFERLKLNRRTYYSIRRRLQKSGYTFPDDRKEAYEIPNSMLNLDLQKYLRDLTEKTWAGAKQQFEEEVLQFLYEHYGYKKTTLAKKLEMSYQMIRLKTKSIKN